VVPAGERCGQVTFVLFRRGIVLTKTRLVRALVALSALALLQAVGASARTEESPRESFIVVLRDDVSSASDVAADHARRYGAEITYVYENALKGYAALLPPQAVQGIERNPLVAWVERDGVVTTTATQTNPPWGLDRIDQRSRPLSGTFTYTRTGSGVKAYIIDTGIRRTHTQFGGRAIVGYDAVTSGGSANDCNGHGTHVAGTVGGSTYGVAKGVTLVAVRVLNCSGSGTTSGVIAGINWVTGNHGAGQPAVANMSLGGGASSSLDTAVRNSIADGVSYAVAAGNSNYYASAYSPARVAEAMTIGATDSSDRRASFSNFGNAVDWFAPGVSILSAWYTSDTATRTISGTSMATPHTAGVAAQYLQSNPSASPTTVRNALYNNTTKGIVTSSNSANNHLLFTNY
jgi:subtilisin family serine protease